MQNHSPHARYVEIRLTEKKYSAEIITVDYDFESAAVRAEMNGRKDWAQYIRTGVAEKIKHD